MKINLFGPNGAHSEFIHVDQPLIPIMHAMFPWKQDVTTFPGNITEVFEI